MAAQRDDLTQQGAGASSKDAASAFPYLWQSKNVGWASEEMLRLHMQLSDKRGLTQFYGFPMARPETAIIVASGPSAREFYGEIAEKQRNGAVVFCVNQSHDWLIENGVKPDYFVALDPCDGWKGVVTPIEGVTYLLASICHPELFDICPPKQTRIFHAWCGDFFDAALDEYGINAYGVVHGAGTAALRCVNLAYLAGHRAMHLYGVDSSYGESGERYAHDIKYASTFAPTDIEVECAGRVFKTARAWAGQATDFAKLFDLFAGHCDIQVFGDGLIPHMARRMNESKSRFMETVGSDSGHNAINTQPLERNQNVSV